MSSHVPAQVETYIAEDEKSYPRISGQQEDPGQLDVFYRKHPSDGWFRKERVPLPSNPLEYLRGKAVENGLPPDNVDYADYTT